MKSIFQITLLWLIACQAYAIHDYPADKYWLKVNDANTNSIDHSAWQKTLDDFLVKDADSGINLVDYAALKYRGLDTLDDYLSAMSATNITNYNKAEQFAFWVNLYNAVTVKLIADNYPVKSIRKLGGWFSLGPWDMKLITVEGIELSLNDIEHRILRPIWQDYRIHFVVNCASLGCPNLLPIALTAENSAKQLNEATKEFIQHHRGVDVAEGVITLSKIFKWYQSDFGNSDKDVLALLADFSRDDIRDELKSGSYPIRYAYDWELNTAK